MFYRQGNRVRDREFGAPTEKTVIPVKAGIQWLRNYLSAGELLINELAELPSHLHPNPPPSRERGFLRQLLIRHCGYSSNSLTSAAIISLAPVRAWTSSGVQPGANSRMTSPSPVRSITARSVTIR